jgi:hypothetical protein
MHGGRWGSKQLIPEDYTRAATSRQVDNTLTTSAPEHQHGYGYQFWRTRFGFGKQVRQTFPEKHYFGRTMMRPGNRGYDCHASAAWRSDDSLVLYVYATDEYFGTLRMNFVFDRDTVTVQSEKFAEMFFNEYQGFTSGKLAQGAVGER